MFCVKIPGSLSRPLGSPPGCCENPQGCAMGASHLPHPDPAAAAAAAAAARSRAPPSHAGQDPGAHLSLTGHHQTRPRPHPLVSQRCCPHSLLSPAPLPDLLVGCSKSVIPRWAHLKCELQASLELEVSSLSLPSAKDARNTTPGPALCLVSFFFIFPDHSL